MERNDENSISEMSCDTCFNEYECEKCIPMSLKCGHTYCESCVKKLLLISKLCPSCRTDIRSQDPVKNYALLRLISKLKIERDTVTDFTEELEALKKKLVSESESLTLKLSFINYSINKIDEEFNNSQEMLNAKSKSDIIADLKSDLECMKIESQDIPKIYATPSQDPMNFILKIYETLECGVKLMCVHQPSFDSGLMYGNVSLWSNTLFFHCLTMKNPENCEKFLSFSDLKKVMPALKIKMFLKFKTLSGGNQVILLDSVSSPLLPQLIRLCTGETGSCYRGATFEKGDDKDSSCKSIVQVKFYQRGSSSENGNVDYAFETKTEEYYKGPVNVIVGSSDGGFQIFYSESKGYYVNVVAVTDNSLNMKDVISYENAKILDCGIAFQL